MRGRTLLIAALALILTGLLGMVVSGTMIALNQDLDGAQRSQSRQDGAPRQDGSPGQGRRRSVDAMFIERMIPHHDDAIAMAKLAETRAEHAELKRLAAQIARTQTAENQQMREWYDEWFGGEVPDVNERGRGPGRGMMMGGQVDLERLEASEDFDRDFIEMMIPHHSMGIMMAGMAGRTTEREEMREFTDDIITTQSEEIDQMRGWYQEWYGR